MKKSISIFIIFLIVSSFGIGLITGVYKTFPYEYFDDAKKIILSEPDIEIDIMNAYVYDVDVSSLIDIENKNDIIEKRNSIMQYVWNSEHLPKIFPEIDKQISDFRYNDFKNLKRIDSVTLKMDYKINSVAYYFIPENSINELIIYHQGHGGDFYNGKNTIEFFLENGYSVLAFSMPLMGMNNQPLVEIPNLGPIILKSHNHLKFLEIFNEKPIRFFIEPITASINYVDEYYDYKSIHMIGISGGGWTTIVYSAIDPRISHSYSIAGSYPLFMQSNFQELSDYEAVIPEFYQIANYLELYLMASYGDDRKLVQIFNEFDKCCWSGDSFKIYEDTVKNVTYNIANSEFDIWLDSTHKDHKISEHSLKLILDSLQNN